MSHPSNDSDVATQHSQPGLRSARFWLLVLGSLGVVYGDIGTSPLYAVKACFSGVMAVPVTEPNVMGVMSIIFWTVTMVVSFKYCMFILRADNNGEGGILALLALLSSGHNGNTRSLAAKGVTALLILFGSALLFGDGLITPAISVLSAVEGLNVATTAFERWIIPITIAILVMLFYFQSKGTERIGKFFGPVTMIWFLVIALLGLREIIAHPHILAAINPIWGIRFLMDCGSTGFFVLGAVALCITGAEALYADMGHFGRPAIRSGWYFLVMPSVMLSYFGQCALILSTPEAVVNPFYSLVPRPLIIPMVVLASTATVIASQALISGCFSMARQAVQLGYCPRLTVIHTSRDMEGQIYVPEINWVMMFGCIGLVLGFHTSDNLAVAYGFAVTGTMLITSIVYFTVITQKWDWRWWLAYPLFAIFLLMDVPLFLSNLGKFIHGGWVPFAMAVVIFTLTTTWKRGRLWLAQRIYTDSIRVDEFIREVREEGILRVDGTAVFMVSNLNAVSPALLHHLRRNNSLHGQVVLLTIQFESVPVIRAKDRLEVKPLGEGFHQVIARYGFLQTPNVPIVLQGCSLFGLKVDMDDVTFYLGREQLILQKEGGMAYWRKILFSFVSRNARPVTAYFGIPPKNVVELGMHIEF